MVSQSDAFMISATRNIQYVLKKLVGLMVFEKDIFDIYLNNIYHKLLSFHYTWLVYVQVNTDCMRCLATK